MNPINANSEIMKKNLEVMNKTLEVINKTSEIMSEVLIRLDRNNRIIPVQDFTGACFRMQGFDNSTSINLIFLHTSGSIKHARAYQSTSFEKVDQEYFLSKTGSQLGKFSKNKSIAIYLQRNPVPTKTEEEVQTWFNDLMKALPRFKKKLAIEDTHKKT